MTSSVNQRWMGAMDGYVQIERVISEYIEGWEGSFLHQFKGRKKGELNAETAIVRKLCNRSFKTRSNIIRRSGLLDSMEDVCNQEMKSIEALLQDEKVRSRFDALSPESSPISNLINLNFWLPSEEVDRMKRDHDNNELFELHMEDVIAYLKEKYNVDLYKSNKVEGNYELQLQFDNKEFRVKNRKKIFSGILILNS